MVLKNTVSVPANNAVKRIVLYGRPSSGKTCFLAALAMARLPHAKGYSCIWVCDSQTIPKPEGKRENWDPHDPKVTRYLGKEWLQKAIDALNGGDVPRATPNDVTPYRLLFDLTMPDGRITRLEMIDYSGELVDPNLAEDTLVKQLLAHLEEADGVLVLAEAPKPTDNEDDADYQAAGQHRELQVLQQALVLVAEKRRKGRAEPVPMGMVINKWDRYTSAERHDEASIVIEKEIFMSRKPPMPQQVLFNVIKAVAGFADNEPFSESFAISAFGKTKIVLKQTPNGKTREVEVPRKLMPLQSYGLEDPLVWVCDKADHLEMRQLTADVTGLRTWKLWQVPSRRALQVRSEVLKVRKRIPAHLPQAQVLSNLASNAVKAFAKQSTFALLMLLILSFGLLQGIVYSYDSWQYARVYKALEAAENNSDPIDNAEGWKEAETFLANYSQPSWYRLASHYKLLPSEVARQKLANLQPKFAEAKRILALREEFEIRVNGLVKQAEATQDLTQVEGLHRDLAKLNVPPEYPGGGPKLAAARSRMDQIREERRVAKAGTDLEHKYRDLMSARKLVDAALLLKNNQTQLPEVAKNLSLDFRNCWYDTLFKEAKEASEQGRWDWAHKAVSDMTGSSVALQLTGPTAAGQCSELKERIDNHRQEKIYRNWYYDKSNPKKYQDVIEVAANADREKAMKWKRFADFVTETKTWEITVEEISVPKYGPKNNNATAVMICSMAGSQQWSVEHEYTTKPEAYRPPNKTFSVNATYTESITLSFVYKTTDLVLDPNDYGSADWTVSMRGLCYGDSKEIVANYCNPKVTLRAKLRSGSIPEDPTPTLRQPKDGSF